MQKKIIIFGSEGFIGKHFRELIESSNMGTVVPFDLLRNSIKEDVRKPISLDGNFASDDIIINLAAVHRTPGHKDFAYFETNIKGAENVCAFAEKKGINTIIFTSSIAPYGASEELKKESSIPMPNTPYGISKLVAEHIHRTWQAKDPQRRKLLILRPGVVFGIGENGNFTRLYRALSKGIFLYPGRKDTIKACIYVKDLVCAALKMLDKFEKGVKLYNMTYEPAPTISEIVNSISEVTGIKPAKIMINGKLLKFGAFIAGPLGGKKLGIHPARVNKLMVSTNVSGEKLVSDGFIFKYGLKGGIRDWFKDCEEKGLF